MAHHHNCAHHNAAGLSQSKMAAAVTLTFGFVVLEAITGFRANSLALLSDAGHNFTDGLALLLSWYALQVAARPANASKTFGYHRAGILTALFNAMTLLIIAGMIFTEAIELFLHPRVVQSGAMIAVSSVAVVLNTLIAVWLHRAAAHDVNIRSAYLHMMGDALSAAGVILAGIFIHFTGWVYADPLISVFIGVFIAGSSWGIVRETVHILLEGAPKGVDTDKMAGAILSVPGVLNLHDLHVWAIADGMNALCCHLRVQQTDTQEAMHVIQRVKALLAHDYAITHSTIETECGNCTSEELYCRLSIHQECDHDHDSEYATAS